MRRLSTLAAGVALLLGLAACSGDDPAPAARPSASSSTTGPTTPAPAPATPSATSPTAGPDGVPAGLERFYAQKPTWRACDGRFQCARLRVPVDYAKPDGRTIELALLRTRATGPRIGSLVVNPGGPGASGVSMARAARAYLSRAVLARYDVVGFDPRGVGVSAPLRCLSDKATDRLLSIDLTPDTAAERQTVVTVSKQLGAGCVRSDPELVRHVSTRDAAKDLDVLRAALGEKALHYLGKSYGTALGTSYAEQFPTRVGRMVLDGAIDPRLDAAAINLGQAQGFEVAARSFVKDCQTYDGCPLTGSVDSGMRQLAALLKRIDAHPLSSSEPQRPATEALATFGLAAGMYEDAYWPILRIALTTAKAGNGDQLLALGDSLSRRGTDGHYLDNGNTVIYAVNCLDRSIPGGEPAVAELADRIAAEAPVFGRYIAWSATPCADWPVPATDRAHAVTAAGSGPIVVVGTTRDPATPYAWAAGLAAQLQNGRLVTYVGDGHTGYHRGSACVDRAVDAWFLRGSAPQDGLRCG